MAPSPFHQRVTAMLADVVEAAHAAVVLTSHDDVLIEDGEGEIVAGLRKSTLMTKRCRNATCTT
jgi:hypothetical protein